jgi:photosystem II stability/assembly factor-like uncharacterized protein
MNGRRILLSIVAAVAALTLSGTVTVGAAADGSIDFTDATHGWTVGRGTLMHTTDGGRTWNRQSLGSLPIDWGLSAVCATGRSTAVAVGESGVFRTMNGGRSWRRVATRLPPDRTYGGVWTSCAFANPQSGWVMSSGGDVISTRDGGRTWTRQRRAHESTDAGAAGLAALGRDRALMGVNQSAATHLAGVGFGGAGWVPLSDEPFWPSNPSIVGIAATNPTTFWIAVGSGEVFRSIDAGHSWAPINGDVGPGGLWARGLIASGNTVIAFGVDVSNRAAAVVTTDGGSTWGWSRMPAGTILGIQAVDMLNGQWGWATTGDGRILRTVDGGQSWQSAKQS